MSITLELTQDEEARLRAAAAREGISPEECAKQFVLPQLPPVSAEGPTNDRTLELLAQWAAEDATDDPEEIRRAEADLQELKAMLIRTPPRFDGAAGVSQGTLALFAQWAAEDATDDPEEIDRRNREWEEFRDSINETRAAAGSRPVYL